MASTALGQPLDDPPGDGITALRFSGTSDLLMAMSWDGVRAVFCLHTWLSYSATEAAWHWMHAVGCTQLGPRTPRVRAWSC